MSETPEQFARVKRLFEEARRLPPGARGAWLDRSCGGDAGLRERIQTLLEALDDQRHDALSETGIGARRGELERALDGDPDPAPWLPERIGRYRVERRIGQGGMGIVYEAVQDSPRRRVAVKLLHPQLATPERVRRFRHEAELLGRLHHPGIAQVHEAGTFDLGHGQQPYFAMELVEGVDVRTHAERARLDVPARLALVATIADAVQHAHECGVIHRDLKPENVLVDERGQAKVLDFGVARASEGSDIVSTLHTQEGVLLGTLAYMAPEQLEGRSEEVTPRVDVYALGVLAYELLGGRLPHDVAGLPLAGAVQRIQGEEPTPLGTLLPALRGDVETIVGKALEKEPARRYASATAFAEDLRAHLAHRPIQARPPSQIYRAAKFTRRHRALVVGTTATLAATLVGLVVSLVFLVRSRASAELARESERRAVVVAVQSAQDALERGDVWGAARTFHRVASSAGDWCGRLVARALPNLVPEIFTGRPLVWADEEHLLVADPGGGLVFLETDTWRETERLLADREWRLVARNALSEWTDADGVHVLVDGRARRVMRTTDPPALVTERWISFLDEDGDLRVFLQLTSGEWRVLWNGVETCGLPSRLRLFPSSDGRRAAFLDDGRLEVFDTDTGALLGSLDGMRVSSCLRLRFLPGDAHLITYDAGNHAIVVETDTVRAVRRVGLSLANECKEIVPSPDASRCVLGLGHEIRVHDFASERHLATFGLDPAGPGFELEFSPDGHRLTVRADGVPTCVIDLDGPPPETRHRSREGPCATRYVAHGHWVNDFTLSPDGRLVASVAPGDAIRVWDAATGETLRTVATPQGELQPEFEEEGQLVAFASDARRLLATVRPRGGPLHLLVHDLAANETSLEALGEETLRRPHLAGLDRFLELLGPAPPVRLSRRAFLEEDGRAQAVQVFRCNLPAGQRWDFFAESNADAALAPSPDGRAVAVVGSIATRVVDRSDRKLLLKVPGPSLCVDWTPDGKRLAVGTAAGRIRILDAHDGLELLSFQAHEGWVQALAWTPDGTRLVSASIEGSLAVWDPRSPRERAADRADYEAALAPLRALADTDLVERLSTHTPVEERFAALRVLLERSREDAPVAPPAEVMPEPEPLHLRHALTYAEPASWVYALAVSPDGRLAACTGPLDPALHLFDPTTGETLATIAKPTAGSAWENNRSQLLVFSADGRHLFATVRDGRDPPELRVVDLLTGTEERRPLPEGLSALSHLSWIDGLIAALEETEDDLVPRPLGRLAFLGADGRAVAAQQQAPYTVRSGARWTAFPGATTGQGLCLSPDGTRVAAAIIASVVIADRDGRPQTSFPGQAHAVAWSPDGVHLAVGGADGVVRVYDTELLREVERFAAHDDYVFVLAWTPDGSRLLSGSGDRTVRVWDTPSAEERAAEHEAWIERVRALEGLDESELRERFTRASTAEERGMLLRAALESRR